jgi:hypothetical protein
MLENAVTELKKANEELRVHLWTALENKINDKSRVSSDALAAGFRDLQASIRIPRDGMDGIDGSQGPEGEKGERGDVLVIGESELAQAVTALRIELKEQHAKHLAVLIEHIEHNKNGNSRQQHFAHLLEHIKAEIERLR